MEQEPCPVLEPGENFIIQTSSREFKVCEYLLSQRSFYFAALFESPWLERCSRRIFYDSFDDNIIAGILSFIHTGIVSEYSDEDLICFAIASDYFLVEDLRDILHTRIRQIVSVDNVFEYHPLADKYRRSFFAELVNEIILENAEELLRNRAAEFNDWPVTEIEQILNSDRLCAREETVFTFLHDYCRHNSLNLGDHCHLVRSLPTEYHSELKKLCINPQFTEKIFDRCHKLAKHSKVFTRRRDHFAGKYSIDSVLSTSKYVEVRFNFSHRVSINRLMLTMSNRDCYLSRIHTDSNQTLFGDQTILENEEIKNEEENKGKEEDKQGLVSYRFDFGYDFVKVFHLKLYFTTISQDISYNILITSYAHEEHSEL